MLAQISSALKASDGRQRTQGGLKKPRAETRGVSLVGSSSSSFGRDDMLIYLL